MKHVMIDRVFPPNKLIEAPYGTLCRVDNEEGTEMYIQLSENEELPQWISMGNFLSKVFHDQLYDKEFIEECLQKYKGS